MPRNVTVTYEDGSKAVYNNVPDDVTPEQVTARAEQESGRRVTELDGGQKSLGGEILRQGKLAASNLVQGAAGLPALAIDLHKTLASKGLAPGGMDPSYRFGQHSRGVEEGAAELFGAKPESLNEKRAASVLQGVGGALAGPGAVAAPIRSAIAGAAGGAGAQIGDEVSSGNPLARLLGGLAGGMTAGVVGNFFGGTRPQVKRLTSEATEGLTKEQLERAALFQAQAKAEGVDLDLVQALDATGAPASNLGTIRDLVANSNAGNRVQETLRRQPGQLQAKTDLTLLKLPGDVRSPVEAANAAQRGSTEAINAAKKARTAAVRDLYAKAGDITEEQRDQLIKVARRLASEAGAPTPLKSEVAIFANKLRGLKAEDAKELAKIEEELGRAVTPEARLTLQKSLGELERKLGLQPGGMGTLPERKIRALDVDTAISELVGPYRGTPISPVDPKLSGAMSRAGKTLNTAFQDMSPNVKAAEAEYARISRESVNPLKQSVVGRMSGKAGYKADTEAPASRLMSIFSAGTDPNATKSDILTLAKQLNAQDKSAFPDAAKTYISGKLAASFEPELGGVPGTSAEAAAKVWNALFADKKHYRGLRDMAAGIADAHSLPRKDVVDGLETLAQLTKALKNRPDFKGLDPKEVKDMAKASNPANLARLWGFLPTERFARRIEDKQLTATFTKFDELLTSPEGAAALAQIGRKGVMSPEALAILAGFQGGAVAGMNNPGNIPE